MLDLKRECLAIDAVRPHWSRCRRRWERLRFERRLPQRIFGRRFQLLNNVRFRFADARLCLRRRCPLGCGCCGLPRRCRPLRRAPSPLRFRRADFNHLHDSPDDEEQSPCVCCSGASQRKHSARRRLAAMAGPRSLASVNGNRPAEGMSQGWAASRMTATGVGGGYGAMAVAGDRVFVQSTRGRTSIVVALNRAVGKEVWSKALVQARPMTGGRDRAAHRPSTAIAFTRSARTAT